MPVGKRKLDMLDGLTRAGMASKLTHVSPFRHMDDEIRRVYSGNSREAATIPKGM